MRFDLGGEIDNFQDNGLAPLKLDFNEFIEGG